MPPKHPKGILGVKKDPKKQILFSLNGRGMEDWPSDDSEDSDYSPEAEGDDNMETSGKSSTSDQKHPRKKLKKSHHSPSSPVHQHTSSPGESTTRSPSSKKTSTAEQDRALGRCWTNGLPWHILLKIFRYIVSEEGCLPFLCRASRVCRFWRHVAYSSTLWQHVDLSYGWVKCTENTLKYLCENMFTRLLSIELATWKNLTNSGLELLSKSCPELEYVGLSNCTKFNADGLRLLIDGCSKLTGLDLSNCSMDAVSPSILKHLIELRGHQMTKLNLSRNTIRGFHSVFSMICTHCPKLCELRLNKVEFTGSVLSINIEKFQSGCPSLRILELSLTSFRASAATQAAKAASPGFTILEEVTLAIDTTAYTTVGLDDDFLSRLLKNATKLRLVDLRGSSSIKCQTLQELLATDIRHLYISLSSVAKYEGIEIIMSKWQHSLRDLDLSWNLYPGMSLDCAIHKLSSKPAHSSLEILNLAGTSISCARIKSLLSGCPRLKRLNLCSCRGLPRGMKREFLGAEIQNLSEDVEQHLEDEREPL